MVNLFLASVKWENFRNCFDDLVRDRTILITGQKRKSRRILKGNKFEHTVSISFCYKEGENVKKNALLGMVTFSLKNTRHSHLRNTLLDSVNATRRKRTVTVVKIHSAERTAHL